MEVVEEGRSEVTKRGLDVGDDSWNISTRLTSPARTGTGKIIFSLLDLPRAAHFTYQLKKQPIPVLNVIWSRLPFLNQLLPGSRDESTS